MFSVNNYIEKVNNQPFALTILATVIAELQQNEISNDDAMRIIKFVTVAMPDGKTDILKPYFEALQQRATPEAVRAAKKTQKTFIEQLIYKDQKDGKISLKMAELAKEMLQDFLTQNKTNEKNA